MVLPSPRVLYGPESEVLEALVLLEVQAVIIPGAWSQPSLRFAETLARANRTIRVAPGDSFQATKGIADQKGKDAKAFRTDLDRFTSMFRQLSEKLKRFELKTDFADQSRLETAPQQDPPWHVDGKQLGFLAVPSGPGTQFLNREIPGWFKGTVFHPASKAKAERHTESLRNGSVMIFKSSAFPFTDNMEQGLIHRVPPTENRVRLDLVRLARVVVHYQMG